MSPAPSSKLPSIQQLPTFSNAGPLTAGPHPRLQQHSVLSSTANSAPPALLPTATKASQRQLLSHPSTAGPHAPPPSWINAHRPKFHRASDCLFTASGKGGDEGGVEACYLSDASPPTPINCPSITAYFPSPPTSPHPVLSPPATPVPSLFSEASSVSLPRRKPPNAIQLTAKVLPNANCNHQLVSSANAKSSFRQLFLCQATLHRQLCHPRAPPQATFLAAAFPHSRAWLDSPSLRRSLSSAHYPPSDAPQTPAPGLPPAPSALTAVLPDSWVFTWGSKGCAAGVIVAMGRVLCMMT